MSHPHICNSLQISQGRWMSAFFWGREFYTGNGVGALFAAPDPCSLCFLCLLCEVLENILPSLLFFSLSLAEGILLGVSVRQHPEEPTSQLCGGEEPSHVLHPKKLHSPTLQSGSCWPRKQPTPRAGVACAGQSPSKPSQDPAPASLCLLHGFQLRNKTMGRQMDDGFVKGSP